MYEQLLTMTNIDPDPVPSKKRRADFIDEPPCKRSEYTDMENLHSGMYTISPNYPTNPTMPNQHNFLQALQDVFQPPFNSQMFPMNFPSFQPTVFSPNHISVSQNGSTLLETSVYPSQGNTVIDNDLELVVDENRDPKPIPFDSRETFDETTGNPKPALFDCRETFDETTGRLCLLNSSTKYQVTLGEIQRRLSHPETLHASLVNSILRKAKLKDGCRVLRNRLAEKGVILPPGRRKTATTTTFTALCEKEAVLMARDFDFLCRNALNICSIARRSNQMTYSLQELDAASRVLAGVLDAFEDVPENPEDYVEKDASTHTINTLSLLTHGFGHNAIKSVIKLTMRIIEQQRLMLHGAPLTYNPFPEQQKPLFM
ncbi:hypothetical protein V3C99_003988 [Haemonchus contortus]